MKEELKELLINFDEIYDECIEMAKKVFGITKESGTIIFYDLNKLKQLHVRDAIIIYLFAVYAAWKLGKRDSYDVKIENIIYDLKLNVEKEKIEKTIRHFFPFKKVLRFNYPHMVLDLHDSLKKYQED